MAFILLLREVDGAIALAFLQLGEPARGIMANSPKLKRNLDNIYNDSTLFKARMMEEIKRARRYASYLSLISVDLSHIDTIGEMEKFTNFEDFMTSMRKFVKKTVRETDLISCTSKKHIWILLVETPTEGAAVVSGRLKKTIRYFLCDNVKSPINWRVPIKEYNFPANLTDNGGIMAAINEIDAR